MFAEAVERHETSIFEHDKHRARRSTCAQASALEQMRLRVFSVLAAQSEISRGAAGDGDATGRAAAAAAPHGWWVGPGGEAACVAGQRDRAFQRGGLG